MPSDELTIRDLTSRAELDQCIALQEATWGRGFRELVPPALLSIVRKIGGVAAGAFERDGALVGFVFGLTGLRDGRPVHWSHMLAVREDRRDRGIGTRLKRYQEARLRAAGVEQVYWTYDPLVARNAYLNLCHLGARVVEYVTAMYGDDPASATDDVIGSDRFVVEWPLVGAERSIHRERLRRGTPAVLPPPSGSDPGTVALPDRAEIHVPVPPDIQALKREAPETARAWRALTRRAFGHYLGRGYVVHSFVRRASPATSSYVLRRIARSRA